jgi:hypothetical protein
MLHVPVQHSALLEHASPGWMQNDEGWQVPPAQSPEQHCAGCVHGLPRVVQFVGRGVQVPPVPQVWLQH